MARRNLKHEHTSGSHDPSVLGPTPSCGDCYAEYGPKRDAEKSLSAPRIMDNVRRETRARNKAGVGDYTSPTPKAEAARAKRKEKQPEVEYEL